MSEFDGLFAKTKTPQTPKAGEFSGLFTDTPAKSVPTVNPFSVAGLAQGNQPLTSSTLSSVSQPSATKVQTFGQTIGGLVDRAKGVGNTVVDVAKGLYSQYANPEPDIVAAEKLAGVGQESKVPGFKYVQPISDLVQKGLFRTFGPMLNPVAKDVAEGVVAKELLPKIDSGEMPADVLLQFDSLQKTAPQIVGDVAQAVLAVYMPSLFKKTATDAISKTVFNAIKTGGIHGTESGVFFGTAQALSSGSKDPAEIAKMIATSAGTLGILGMITSGIIPVSKEMFRKVTEARNKIKADLVAKGVDPKTAEDMANKGQTEPQYTEFNGLFTDKKPAEPPAPAPGEAIVPKVDTTWSELQKTNPDLFNTGILRKSQAPYNAVGEIPLDVHSAQTKWQNYGQDSEVSADVLYKRENSGPFKGDYVDSQGFPVRDPKTDKILSDTYDEATGEYIKPTVPNEQLRNNLLEQFKTPEGKKYLDEVINALPKNSDGTITAYRIGSTGDGVQSYTLSEGMAKTFSNQGTVIMPAGTPGLPKGGYKDFGALPANMVKIDPKGIKAWSPYDAEILVDAKSVSKFKPTSTTSPLDQEAQPQTGKVAKASSDINTNITKKGFDELSPEQQAQYSPITKADQIKKVADLIQTDYAKARDMALGKEPITGDINSQVIFNAVKNKALMDGDVATLRDLASSPIAQERSLAAQKLGAAGFDNGTAEGDPVKAIQDVIKSREKAAKRKGAIDPTKTVKEIKDSIKKSVPTKETWASFVESITC